MGWAQSLHYNEVGMARPAGAGPRWQVQHADAGGWYDDKKIHIAAPLVGTTVAKDFKDGGLAAGRVKKIEEGITYVTYDDGDKEEFINNLEEEMADLKQAVFDGLPQLQTPVKQAGRPTEGRIAAVSRGAKMPRKHPLVLTVKYSTGCPDQKYSTSLPKDMAELSKMVRGTAEYKAKMQELKKKKEKEKEKQKQKKTKKASGGASGGSEVVEVLQKKKKKVVEVERKQLEILQKKAALWDEAKNLYPAFTKPLICSISCSTAFLVSA